MGGACGGGACGPDPEWEELVTRGPSQPAAASSRASAPRGLCFRIWEKASDFWPEGVAYSGRPPVPPCSTHVEEGAESGSPEMPGVGRRKEKGENRRWRMWKHRKHQLGREPKRKPCASAEKVSIRSSRPRRAGVCTVRGCMRPWEDSRERGRGGLLASEP